MKENSRLNCYPSCFFIHEGAVLRVLSKSRKRTDQGALEAFSYDYENYYPAINAAYILFTLGHLLKPKEEQIDENSPDKKQSELYNEHGYMLARYILMKWEHMKGNNWWLDSTIAQAEMLIRQYAVASDLMKKALTWHANSISVFELQTTEHQIKEYLKVIGQYDNREKQLLEPIRSHALYKKAAELNINVI